ncbi:hypothetical protein MML48_5g00000862 [Holotrichia oblita]|uniref:Uncharacterized protein n=1 Tax=Holotrichia oblita TaxID=644536 RepID=A0ACB9T4U4_HOLOL|nr:hypothetical protein MML48_5g00000862 [Holotrichia oblita]
MTTQANCSRDDTEMEYEILSKIASVWVLKTAEEVSRKTNDGDVSRENVETLLSMEFSHPAKNSTLGLWNVNCAVTDFASYGYTWDVQGCRTRILDSSTTRCTCSRTGTFAVLMTKIPNYVSRLVPWLHFNASQTRIESICNSEEQETKHLIVLVGCATCLALALVSCFALLTCWIVRRTCLEFIKIQCCCSITGAMIVFMYSLGGDLPAVSLSSQVYTMQTPETDNESAPSYQSTYFCKNGAAETHFSNETMCKHKVAEISSPTFKTYASAKFSQARLDCLDYGANVQEFTTISPSVHYEMEYIPSPDILATEKYAELDLVASSMQKPQISSCSPKTVKHQTKSPPPPKITIVTVSSEVDSDSERHQPDGEEKIGTSELSAEIKDKPLVKIDDKLDEMMNQISHDLDYLLNDRDNEVEMQPSLPVTQTLRRLSKPQICVFEQIAEETEDEDIKVPEAITDVSRTEC